MGDQHQTRLGARIHGRSQYGCSNSVSIYRYLFMIELDQCKRMTHNDIYALHARSLGCKYLQMFPQNVYRTKHRQQQLYKQIRHLHIILFPFLRDCSVSGLFPFSRNFIFPVNGKFFFRLFGRLQDKASFGKFSSVNQVP